MGGGDGEPLRRLGSEAQSKASASFPHSGSDRALHSYLAPSLPRRDFTAPSRNGRWKKRKRFSVDQSW